ncbi:hypothetical protein OG407_17820 [Streptomyces sp. NBC_01515]|uniref:hypothetical protein n=1 Tax=Streptomyces sp. NBC_01515 TaxID=2903890 RepID=UPI00386411AA
MHRPPYGEFTELPSGWSALVELEGADLSWVRPGTKCRVVPAATGTEPDRPAEHRLGGSRPDTAPG